MPKVAAIIPNYNHAGFLEQRIESVLNQTYQDFELLMLDDASTDHSIEVFEKYADHPKVQAILRNPINTGIPFKQWNKGVAMSRSEYIWMAESDDYADPKLLEKLVALLDRYPNVGVAYCQSWMVNENNTPLSLLKNWTDDLDKDHWASDYVNDGKDECRRYLALKCTIPNASGVVFRRSVYEEVGGADEDFRQAGDWMLWIKFLLISDVAYIAEPLNYFRMHANTVRSSSTRSAIALQEAFKILGFIQERIEIPEYIRSEALDRLLDRWVTEISKARFGLSINMEIYRSLRGLDPGIHGRILERLSCSMRRRVKRVLRSVR